MTVQEIMTTKVISVNPEASIEEAFARMRKDRLQTLPVITAERLLVGMFTVRMFLKKAVPGYIVSGDLPDVRFAPDLSLFHERLGALRTQPVSAVMEEDHPTVDPDTSVLECAALLINPSRRIRSLPVVDHSRRLLGIVTGWDIIKRMYTE